MKLHEAIKQVLISEAASGKISTEFMRKLKSRAGYMAYGPLELGTNEKNFYASYSGNSGNTVEHSINPALQKLGLPTVAELLAAYPNAEAEGSADYSWMLTIPLKDLTESKLVHSYTV
jgi:hypothetical protein